MAFTLVDDATEVPKKGKFTLVEDGGREPDFNPITEYADSFVNNAKDFGKAALHHTMNLPHGAAQFVEHIGAGLAQKIAPDSKFANAISNTAMSDDAAMAERERQYQASTPDSAASYTGATAGELLPFLAGNAGPALEKVGGFV